MSIQLSSFPALPARRTDVPLSLHGESLRRGLVKLSRRTQQVFLLSRLDGASYAHIADLLSIDVALVEQAMVRVLQHSRRQVAADEASAVDPVCEQASRWYVHLQSPQATASQRIEFRHWLDADLAHLAAFESTERLWRQLQAPAAVIGASGWHRRKRRSYLFWCMATAFLCSLLMTAEAFALLGQT
ncbi:MULTISPECIES: DUF4880 domain-containing protein [Pseudomonas]|uniref:DUF4880 domain-containing protein n=1 Tax=Pseudomonas phytophila TaxID=2867264 RepID=A0ABY6F7Z4_9PSED|nr:MULTISPECIES: DUF4880 domain-containing protein [Pseudomonas]MCQ2996960.1 DUF4880 domain-containing protein [Pseudomonas syringae]MCD5991820.1 DUF4880 domain-containing protein [Pseudomonas quasicaspiana]MCQ3003052.1 DUF4880 domain-containing protein [Pseudomonas syringae]MCQ3033205.1 DUF4880 domain-containing protein [Pseudomonas syringae]MDG6400362.1 DUF4880 domain-containing protein [Pseudomonas quasicaspiana]